MHRWIAVALLALAVPRGELALALDPEVPPAQLAITRWDRRDGLPTTTLRPLAVTPGGLLWTGCDLGLVAFDGRDFTVYTVDTTPELPSDAVFGLAAVGDTLWIGTARGLARWRHGVFQRVDGPGEAVKAMRATATGAVWVATARSVLVLAGDHFERVDTGEHGACGDITALPDGDVALACDTVVVRMRGRQIDATIPIPGGVVAVAAARDGSLWVGGRDGAVQRLAGGRLEPVLRRDDSTFSLYVDSHDALWIGGEGPGIQRRRPDGVVDRVTLAGTDPPAGTWAFLEEPGGALLVTTVNLGLVRIPVTAFRVFDERSGAPTNALTVYEDRAGALWIAGVTGPALTRITPAEAARHFDLPAPALAHLEERDGTHLVGTPAGLFRIEGDAFVKVPLDQRASFVGDIARGPDGSLWIASLSRGFYRIRDDTTHVIADASGTPLNAMKLLLGRDGRTLWFATGAGACRVDALAPPESIAATPRCLREDDGMPAALTLFLYEDAAGSVWVGTYEHGLVRIKDDRAVALGRRHGLPSESVYAVLADERDRLWLPGPTGITRVARAQLDAVADGRAARVEARLFDDDDGMPLSETTGGSQCAHRGPSGRMWFATPAGAIGIDPAAPDPRVISPSTIITELSVNGATLAHEDQPIAPGRRDLVVRYSAPTFERADELRFRYRLDGVDPDWIDAGTRRVASYADLGPGRHRFEVEALAAGAGAFGSPIVITLEMQPRFVETVGFRVLIGLLALALIYAFYRLRVRGLVAREAELEHLVEVRTQGLEEARHALESLNADLARRVETAVASQREAERMAAYGHTVAGVAHEVRQPLFALGTTAFVLGDKLRDRPDVAPELKLLDRETRRMNRVMEELLEFARPHGLLIGPTTVGALVDEAVDAFRASHDPEAKVPVAVTVSEADRAREVRIDASRLQQVLINLLANAQKHAAGMTRVELSARCDHAAERLHLEVADDGAGIATADVARVFEPFFTTGGTGIGLALARRIVRDHGGSLDVRSGPDGTIFSADLPMRGASSDG